ncbi:MAG TPA: hypothetical protein VG966_13165 [Hyphomicrobiaceae bacterium]|nr:hypothetical protein [Hyphomicrobiaceae bacterium]
MGWATLGSRFIGEVINAAVCLGLGAAAIAMDGSGAPTSSERSPVAQPAAFGAKSVNPGAVAAGRQDGAAPLGSDVSERPAPSPDRAEDRSVTALASATPVQQESERMPSGEPSRLMQSTGASGSGLPLTAQSQGGLGFVPAIAVPAPKRVGVLVPPIVRQRPTPVAGVAKVAPHQAKHQVKSAATHRAAAQGRKGSRSALGAAPGNLKCAVGLRYDVRLLRCVKVGKKTASGR